ncbi:MAG: hypothetical protein OEV64_07890 [Desulfobulbaceae bacterium]|nr:hypothetical protein [Desulfobulbaceae bacterium]
MIDIPIADDFFTSGKELLDFSWGVVAKLLIDIDEAEYFGIDPEEISDSYWAAAKRRLTTALSITQQGVEFVLKGRIAQISPYLLIADPPSKWPSPYSGKNISFSDFRTIDAQDLIRVIDTFSEIPMSKKFADQFHQLRDKRNKIMHSVDKQLTVNVTEVIDSILFMHKALFPNERWPSVRHSFLEEAPNTELGANEFSTNRVCWEISLVINLLNPSKVKEYFGVDKKQRRYICPECISRANTDGGFEFKLAVLKPNKPTSKRLYCPVCNRTHTVTRENCEIAACKGNVISEEWGCLSCCNG